MQVLSSFSTANSERSSNLFDSLPTVGSELREKPFEWIDRDIKYLKGSYTPSELSISVDVWASS